RMGARVEAGRRLPDGGPRRYLHALRETRARLERSIANPALNSEERELLARIPATLDRIEDSWDTLARATALLPARTSTSCRSIPRSTLPRSLVTVRGSTRMRSSSCP